MGQLSLHQPCVWCPDPGKLSQTQDLWASDCGGRVGVSMALEVVSPPHIRLPSFSQGCSGDERQMAKMVADTISRTEKQVVVEGQEPAQFWIALGGKAPYASNRR